jgi:hypothetical protein
MKRWHVLVIALIGCSWIATGAFWTIRENRRNAEVEAMQNREAQRGQMGDRSNWRVATSQERAAAVAVIGNQLKAFKNGDFQTALNLQSTQLRSNFSSPESFGRMMKENYPDYLTYKTVHFGRGRVPPSKEGISIRVVLTAQDGSEVHSVYHLIYEGKKLLITGVSGGLRDSAQRDYERRDYQQPPGQPLSSESPASSI